MHEHHPEAEDGGSHRLGAGVHASLKCLPQVPRGEPDTHTHLTVGQRALDTYIHKRTHTSNHTPTHTSIHTSTHTYIYSYIHPFMHPVIHAFIHIHPFMRPPIHTFIHTVSIVTTMSGLTKSPSMIANTYASRCRVHHEPGP